jgi:hypothetical protein
MRPLYVYLPCILLSCCISFAFTHVLKANITQGETLEAFQKMTENATPQSLVIFDINDTVLVTDEELFQSSHKYQRLALQYELEEIYSKDLLEQFWNFVRLKSSRRLIDSTVVELVLSLQNRNTKVIALTTAGMGPLNEGLSLEDWKLNILEGFRINFSKSFPEDPCLRFDYLLTKHPKRYAGFKKGIVFTCGLSKGLVLSLVLKKLNYKPDAIFFIDDKLKNLLSVEEVCKKLNIPFRGYHYTAVQQVGLKALDKKKIHAEFEAFLNQRSSS